MDLEEKGLFCQQAMATLREIMLGQISKGQLLWKQTFTCSNNMNTILKTYRVSKYMSHHLWNTISRVVNFFGAGVMLGSILCWGLGLSVFYVIILACSPTF